MMRSLVLIAALVLAGCGAREDLKPAAGKSLPVAPYGAEATPKAPDLLQAPSQTRPARGDDLLRSSDERRSDEFDLPPR